jgi:hypothetical protein
MRGVRCLTWGIYEYIFTNILDDFAQALKWLDGLGVQEKSYSPGVGPFTETRAVIDSLKYLKKEKSSIYGPAQIKRNGCPDLMIPGEWALEFKLMRPYRDNGDLEDFWFKKILYPYDGNASSIGDCVRLINGRFPEKKGIIMIGYQHNEPKLDLRITVKSFELIAKEVRGIQLSKM